MHVSANGSLLFLHPYMVIVVVPHLGSGKHRRKWRRPTGVQRRSHSGSGQCVSTEAYDWQASYNNWYAELYGIVCARVVDLKLNVRHRAGCLCGIPSVLVLYWLHCHELYTVGHKKRYTFIFVITLANIDRFLYFFHCYIQQWIAE